MRHHATQYRKPEQGNIQLILWHEDLESSDQPEANDRPAVLYLDIPIRVIMQLCHRPRKYLRYLGWCILGGAGHVIPDDGPPDDIGQEGELDDGGVYRYIKHIPGSSNSTPPIAYPFLSYNNTNPLACAVDPEVNEQDSKRPSQSGTSITRRDFREGLLERDGGCVFSRMEGEAMHFIPLALGDDVSSCFRDCTESRLSVFSVVSSHC